MSADHTPLSKPGEYAMWLTGPEEKRNKKFLQRALEQLTPQPVLLPDTSGE